jgi:hypothetical protein
MRAITWVPIFILTAAPALAGPTVTTVTLTGEIDDGLSGVSSVTVDGESVPVVDGTFEAAVTVPSGATSASFVIEAISGGEAYTRTVDITLEDLGPPIDGLDVSVAELKAFLGGKGGKLVWVDAGTQVRVLDFTGSTAQVELLSTDIPCVNPIISPDGTRVVYSVGNATGSKVIRVRNIATGAYNDLPNAGDIGYWVQDGTNDYIVYSDWSAKEQNGADGSTWEQQLVTGGTATSGAANLVHDRAMDGGVNADMSWLGQVYNEMYAYDVGNDTEYSYNDFFLLDGSVADHQTCNGSMAPDSTGRLMLLVIPHDWVRIFSFVAGSGRFEETSRFVLPDRMNEWEFPDWSTDPGYFTAVLRGGGSNLRLYVAKVAEGEVVPEVLAITPWNTSVKYSHLWVAP